MGEKNSTSNGVETEYTTDGGLSLDVGSEDSEVRQTGGEGTSFEFDQKAVPQADEANDRAEPEEDAGEEAPEAAAEESNESDPVVAEDLGEFKAEEIEKWEKTYTKEGGLFDTERLSSEWWGNKKDPAAPGKLHEGTYAFLERKGFSREDVDAIGAALEEQAATIQDGLAERVGGSESLEAALQWGRAGGYSQDQIDRFNKAMDSRNLEIMQEAVDLLSMRYAKANPAPAKKEPAVKPKETRGAAVPKSTEGVEKYSDMDEQIAAGISIRKIKDPVARKRAYDKHFSKMI
jgi:hypothetical protein